MRLPLSASALVPALLLVSSAAAQQFVYQGSAYLPGNPRWTEGVECADIDNDGDLDIFFAEGDGFASPGSQRQNILIVNQQVEIGPGNFVNQSIARLGSNASHARGVATGDVNGDGYVDAVFANGFNTDPPHLYINQGASNPGFFNMESLTRGLTEALSSASGQFGDLDDDGDLDLILNDSGASYLGGSGGKPRLYMNDGNGNFTENAAGMAVPNKIAHMDVQLVDVDNDWDLDFVGANRGSNSNGNHYLCLNDGTGFFTNASNLIPANSSSTYENEVGDLDGDKDLDMFFVSLSGFSEGHVRNDLVENGGTLGFTNGATLPGFVDDNEIAHIDYDNDGLLDVVVGSLGSTERIYHNNGSLNFSQAGGAITSVSDSTLDVTIADIDGDGAYDIISAQGESNSGQWANKVYLNTGAADTVPPSILRTNVPASPSAWPVITKAHVQDQVIDDSVNYLTGHAVYSEVLATIVSVDHVGGAFSPAATTVPSGTLVRFTNLDSLIQTVTSTTSGYTFNLGVPANGGSADYVFVSPGVYTYTSQVSGANGTITVTGSPDEVAMTYMSGGMFRAELDQLPPTATDSFAVEMHFVDWNGNESSTDSAVVDYPALGCTGAAVSFCSTSANSVGSGALISHNGSRSVAANSFELVSQTQPSNQFGLFFYSGSQVNGGAGIPFGDGLRCVGGSQSIYRLPVINSGGSGVQSFTIDFGNLPTGGGISGGDTLNFQSWYRDPGAGASGFNLSDGLQVTFCP